MTLSSGNPTILIIDDTPSNLSVVVDLFEDRGYRVSIAQDGEEGLLRSKLLRPDLIMLDVMMPGMDGFETCRRLKEETLTRDVPVIFMTALASAEHKVKGFQSGAVDYVTKPLQIEEVIARACTHLKLHAAQKKLAEHNEALERRVAERTAELAAREREFRTLAENHPDGIVRLDAEGRHLFVNDAALRSAGLTGMALLGKTVCELPVPGNPAVLQPVFDAHQRVVTGGKADIAEFTWPNGRTTEMRHIPEFDGQGSITSVLAITRDITERKQADRLLHEREQAILAVVENSPDTIIRYDDQCRRIYLNPAMAKVFGRPREELLGSSPAQSSPLPSSYLAAIKTVLETGVEQRLEASFLHADGSARWVDLRLAPEFDGDGKVTTVLAIGRDFTERKIAEQALAASEREFRTLVENVPDNIARHDMQGRLVYINPQMQRTIQRPSAALYGKTPVEFTPALQDAQRYLDCILAVAQTGNTREYEMILPDRGDGPRYHSVLLVAERDAEDKVAGVLTLGRDLTERKRAERLLHEQEQAIRAVVENSPDAHARYDRQFRRLYVNPATQSLLGLPPEEIIGTTPDAGVVLPPEFTSLLESVFESGKELRTEMPFRWSNGEQGWGDVRIVPEFGPDGSVATVLSIGRDITERKRIELALQENEQRYREIFDNAVEGIYLLEVTEDGRFRNIDVNPALAASTGIPREAMIGKFVDETVSEEVGKLIVEKYRRCVAGGKTLQEQIELDLPAGKHYFYSTITPIHNGERIHRLIGISRDITELKRAERELQESREQLRGLTAQREAAREEERKHIAREVHDELGQLLTGLKLNVSVLAHMLSSGQEIRQERLQESMQLTDRALGVARNVASALRPAALDMGIVSALEWLAGRFAKNTGIQCELSVLERDIQLEENQAVALFRIVQESLTNVSRHAQACRVDISLVREGDDYILKVRDNGLGFDANMRKAESFGLVGIRERALLLGGTVDIKSQPGNGAEVVIRIPVQKVRE